MYQFFLKGKEVNKNPSLVQHPIVDIMYFPVAKYDSTTMTSFKRRAE